MQKIKLKNIYYILIATATLFFGFGYFSDYSNANDCSIVSTNENGDFISLKNRGYENLLPKDAMAQALINLKSFCCNQGLFKEKTTNEKCKQDSIVKTDGIYPSSAYLYDHILDISMRRLDAKQENDNGADLLYSLEPDEKGVAWRDFITKHANSKNGSIPLQISTKFKENWDADEYSLKAWNPNSDTQTSNKVWDNLLKEYDKRNLASRYKGVCETSIYIYLNYPLGNKDRTRLNTAYKQCEEITNERIQKEFNYTKAVLMQKGTRLLYNNVKTYLDTYFSQNKLVELQQLVFNIKNTFNEVNKAVLELVPNCN